MRWCLGLLVILAAGCNCGENVSCRTTADCQSGQVCSTGRCQAQGDFDGGDGDGGSGDGGARADAGPPDSGSSVTSLVRLEVAPASSTLVSANGAHPTQGFVVTAHFDDGSQSTIADADFAVDRPGIGTVAPIGGPFTASGLVGGTATITVEVSRGGRTVQATATVQVKLELTFAPTGAPANLAQRFLGASTMDPARAPEVVYPLDGVVLPQNVAPVDVQWLRDTTGDWARVTFSKPDVTFTTYVQEDGSRHAALSAVGWRALAQTNPLDSASLEVMVVDTATGDRLVDPRRTVRFASVSLVGSVYAWDIARGRIVRIDDGSLTRTEFMPSPPAAVDGSQCVGCHTVGPSGRVMAGRLGGGDNIGGLFDLTVDLSGNPAPTVWPVSAVAPETPKWWFASFNPDETRLVVSTSEGGANAMAFLDPRDGGFQPVANTPTERMTHPAWSPDGTRIAYVQLSGPGEWGGDARTGDLRVVPVTGRDTLGPAATIHSGGALAGDTPGGSADGYPTWTPDSKWLTFSHGTNNRSEGGEAALYLMKPDGTEVRRLAKACGGATTTNNFQPRFSPFKGGGYYWMSFLSTRDYGNEQVGTRGTARQQIWVTAVQENPRPGVDPSEVAYWLPGQNTQSKNIAAFWAPRPCRPQGSECTVGTECCSGDCRADATGALKCSPPPPERCRREGETCGGASDCCQGLQLACQQNVCAIDIQ